MLDAVPFLIDQKHGANLARCIFHSDNEIALARIARHPGVRRGILMQHHAHHRASRPFLAVRRAFLGSLHQTGPMQVNLGHRVAQRVVMPFAQLFVEMLDREAAAEIAIQARHPFDLRRRRPAQRRRQAAVVQT
jgi:hypothetical protein